MPLDKEEKESLKNLIVYFGCRIPCLQEVKLTKLIYIAQLYHYSNYGKLLTKLPFVNFSYGPHAPAIRSVIKEQLESNAIYLEKCLTETEQAFSNPCLIIRSCESKEGELSEPCLNTIIEVIQDWRDKTFRQVLDYTVRTIPFISTAYRDYIDLARIQPSQRLKSGLSLPQRIQLHRFVHRPESAVGQASGYISKACPVSINEVAEIYFAMCGDLPEEVPSQDHLGFNAQAVLEALGTLDEKSRDGMEKYLTDIDKAAQLAAALLNPRNFKCHNELVALKTGMLFLRRLGYSFDRKVLQENSPQRYDYKKLRQWFSWASISPSAG